MEDNVEPYSFDLNLDFLDSTTTIKNATITPQYQEHTQKHSTYDIESLASRIATVNDMAIQMKATKDDNLRLQKQMQDLSESALSIRAMYDQEKADRLKFKKLYEDLKEKYEQAESRLANKTLHFDQIQSKMELEAEDKKPITYCELALKYQRLALHHEEEKQLPSKEKVVVQLVKEYLESKKLSPLPVFKKKSHSRVKSEARDFTMQYNFKYESKSQETQCSFGYAEEESKDTCTQGTQYTWYTTTRGTNTPACNNPKPEVKTQGTQYISSTTTRGTSTSTFIKTQSIGTNFPEPVPPVSIEDIFDEMICNVSPLSPMSANSQAELKEEKVEMKSIGTCTDLKNVRKPIEYTAANIKNSDSRPPSRNSNLFDRVKNEIPFMGMPTLNPFVGLGIPVTPMHNTVAELWTMLGHTIFALLQQNSGAATAVPLNPLHMNVLNDRMRNLNGRNRPPSELQRNCESQTRDDYFQQEYPGEYQTATRSAATSPILPTELENSQPPLRSSVEATMRAPYQPVDIKKIFLNKNFSDSVVSSSRKSSQVDEILQLFPEYSDSFKKRKAIKRLLKEATKNKKSKKKRNSTSCSSSSSIPVSAQFSTEEQQRPASLSPVSTSPQTSIEASQIKPLLQNNWKTEIFGESYSDSSLDDPVMDYIKAHTPQPVLDEKWTPIETKPPPNQLDHPVSCSSFEIKRPKIKSPMEAEYFEFGKGTNVPQTSDELFCKPFLPPKGQKSVILSDSTIQKRTKVETKKCEVLLNSKTESNEEINLENPQNTRRKRRTKRTDSSQKNKIYKLDETPILTTPKTPPESKKPKRSLSLEKNKVRVESILAIQPSATYASGYEPLVSLNMNKTAKTKQEPKQQMCGPQNQTIEEQNKKTALGKSDWMNIIKNQEKEDVPSLLVTRNNHGPMVMKVEKPPDSVFEDIKTCFTNQKQDSVVQDIKNCFISKQKEDTKPFIGPIMPIPPSKKENVLLPVKSIPLVTPIEDGTFRFLIQNPQSTINSNRNPSINPIQCTETSLKILNCYQSSPPERNSKSSVTILNEHEMSPQLNGLKTTLQECPLTASAAKDNLTSGKKALDLENMPIYFLDDQHILQHSDQSNEETLNFEAQQKAANSCQNLTILPAFEEIQRGLKSGSSQFIASSNGGFQTEELQKADEPQLENRHLSVQGYPSNFKENPMTLNFTEAMPIARDDKPKALTLQDNSSCLELNQKQLTFWKESSISTNIDEEEQLVEAHLIKSGTVDSEALSSPKGQFKDPFRSTIPTDEIFQQIGKSSPNHQSLPDSKFLTEHRETFSKEAQPKTQSSKFVQNLNKSVQVTNFKSQIIPPIAVTTMNKDDISSSSSDCEGDLSIDCPPSPQPTNSSSLDLSAILKTPEKTDNCEVKFKTPDSFPKNESLISKVITNSTEKLVEEYLLNESPGDEGPKFQVFLDRILDDVAPPTSPISALAPSEKPNHSESESTCDEASPEKPTPIKYKRKAAATAAIAVKRSARISARQIDTTTNMVNSLCSLTIPNIELGKYTKRNTSKQLKKQEKLVKSINEEKIDIKMGFFRETMEEEDEKPTCEPIRRHPIEDINEYLPEKPESEIEIMQSKSEHHKQTSSQQEYESYLSLYNKSKQSIPLYLGTEESNKIPATDSSKNPVCKNSEDSLQLSYESPASPPPPEQMPTPSHTVLESFELLPISTENSSRKTIISHLIATYNQKFHNVLDKDQALNKNLLVQLQCIINEFLKGECHMIDTIRFVDAVIDFTSDDKIICKALVNVIKLAPRPETEVTEKIPDTYLSQTHRKLLNALRQLCYHYPNLHKNLQMTIEQSIFTFAQEVIKIEVLLNLTQFYLAIINNPTAGTNPARLFICKCLYFYNIKAIPLIYHTLCVYPTVLPQKIDPTYDRSDILISTIQSILMSTYYDPEKFDLMGKQIVAKLRMVYNYESFKPPRDEVIENIIAKIKAGRFKNVSFALSVICKRMEQSQTEKFILTERLMPLANEFYHTFSQCSENDEKIACVLECISFVIKPFNVNTDISQYVNLFGRFLNAASDRKVVQEAAVAAILRTARFGYVQCFNAIYNFKPTYELSDTLMLMLRSFIYKRGLVFLNALERQAQELLTT